MDSQTRCDKHLHELDSLQTLDGIRAQMRQIEPIQTALARIKVEVAGLVPEFEILSSDLGVFADIWNEVRCGSLFFSVY